MPKKTDRMARSRWIVQGTAVSSGMLLKHVQADPTVREVRKIASDVVVLCMTPVSAERLKVTFADLIIEPDTELDIFT